ncbi:hypothetical protein RSOLAG22IIIB_09021 [Rhizoctonia solani]|uniref:Uncharacterized protein n=1 Tax=Rhizoctonia solani TaxID=456999 RepID=A0A0K6FWH0_9AGAM|nr:hypothetical protein RSOLAG22IIIB_09021 [Rhizoctonia solani]
MRDVLVTVHACFIQLRRLAVIDATEVTSMKLVTLVNDGTATFHTPTVPAINESAKPESITQIISLGSGFDTLASGTELTRRIRTVLEVIVAANLKSELVDRPYAKLAAEAERVEAILNVSAEVNTGVEGLQQDAMDGTGVGLADVESVMLHGGNTHVPFVRTVAENTVGSAKLATDVNADEACVLVTAIYGASLSYQFKTKHVEVQDAIVCVVYPC